MASSVPSRILAQNAKKKARRYTPEEWEQQKANVERLYVTENKALREVIEILDQQFGFTASEKQLKSRLKKWDLDVKNLNGDTVLEIARTKAKRATIDNKKSSFRVNKKPVDDRKIDRYLQRNDISEEQLLYMASPVHAPSPDFSVYTPHSLRSPTPGLDLVTRATRSTTPSHNFQNLSLLEPPSIDQATCLATTVEDTRISVDQPPGPSSVRPSHATVENDLGIDGGKNDTKLAGLISNFPPSVPQNELKETNKLTELSIEIKPTTREHLHRPSPQCAWPTIETSDNGQLWYEKVHSREEEKHGQASDKVEWAGAAPSAAFEIVIYRGRVQPLRHEPGQTFKHPQASPEEKSIKEESTTFGSQNTSEGPQPAKYFRIFPQKLDDIPSKPIIRKGDECKPLQIWYCDSCGEEGGMTTNIDHCPACGHLRCSTCALEWVKMWY